MELIVREKPKNGILSGPKSKKPFRASEQC